VIGLADGLIRISVFLLYCMPRAWIDFVIEQLRYRIAPSAIWSEWDRVVAGKLNPTRKWNHRHGRQVQGIAGILAPYKC